VCIEDPFDQYFDSAAGFALTMESRPNHAGVVDDQKVTRGQEVSEIAELAIMQCGGRDVQQS
jgi:hypothetical protein